MRPRRNLQIRERHEMWTEDNRAAYERNSSRYPSDLTDEEWALVGPLMPQPRKARRHR